MSSRDKEQKEGSCWKVRKAARVLAKYIWAEKTPSFSTVCGIGSRVASRSSNSLGSHDGFLFYLGIDTQVYIHIPGAKKLMIEMPLVIGTIPCIGFSSRNSSITSQFSMDISWLALTMPEHPEGKTCWTLNAQHCLPQKDSTASLRALLGGLATKEWLRGSEAHQSKSRSRRTGEDAPNSSLFKVSLYPYLSIYNSFLK